MLPIPKQRVLMRKALKPGRLNLPSPKDTESAFLIEAQLMGASAPLTYVDN